LLGIGLGDLGPAPTVAHLIDEVGAWAGTHERRVAGSLVVLGYSARLVGPTIAVLLRDGILLDVRGVHVAYEPSTGFRLSLPDPAGWRAPVTQWGGHVVDGPLAELIEEVSAAAPVAAGLLWGNVASGVAGALRSIAQSNAVTAEECLAAGSVLLEYGPLRGGGALTIHNGQLQFARRSCCLFYRLEGGGLCGDCALLK
jgi:hypothetical protein